MLFSSHAHRDVKSVQPAALPATSLDEKETAPARSSYGLSTGLHLLLLQTHAAAAAMITAAAAARFCLSTYECIVQLRLKVVGSL